MMGMVKKLSKHGNGRALTFDKGVLELLNITDETELEITTNGSQLIISPITGAEREKRFKSALDETNRKHGKTLKALANK